MIIVNFTGLDLFLIGELNEKCHSNVAKAFNVKDEDLIFTASDSFVFYKGHEQTSFNLVIRIDAPRKYFPYENDVKKVLFEACKDYSIHVRLYFSYFDENSYYESINKSYVEFLESSHDVGIDDSNYNENREDYDEDDIYLGNIFEDNGIDDDNNDIGPTNFDDILKNN
ncbi:MAG: hypothetical protein PUA56_02095 [Bacillales bacterium]|nr:hypothetical protein [Bacillales bacterium]